MKRFQISHSFVEVYVMPLLFIEVHGGVFGLIEVHGITGFADRSASTAWNSQNRIKTTGYFPDVGFSTSRKNCFCEIDDSQETYRALLLAHSE